MDAPLPDLVLYGRDGCGLCEEARSFLEAELGARTAAGRTAPALRVVDIETDEALLRAHAFTIPVVSFAGRTLELATSPAKLRRLLDEGLATIAAGAAAGPAPAGPAPAPGGAR